MRCAWLALFGLCIIGVMPAIAEHVTGLKTVTDSPEITDEILLNPGMGLFFMPGLTGDYDKDWFMPIVSVAYFRVDWSSLEPEEGQYKFDEVFRQAFDYWLSRGKRVAFRVMSSNMHSRQEYVTPRWVFEAGVPGVEHRGLYIPRQIDPPFWHPLYIEKQAAFIRALGKKYNGMKGLEFVDIGAVGEWGESHLMRWSPEDKKKTGYTPTLYTRAYMRFIDLYREAFPNTPLALNCLTSGAGHNDVIVDYAVSKGIWLRQDGLTPHYPRTGATAYYHQYFQRVKTLYELCYSYQEMANRGMSAMATFKRGLEDRISYLNLMGAWELRNMGDEDREACRYAARSIGYRLTPVAVEHQEAIRIDPTVQPRLWLKITWRNLGSAPCYAYLAIEIVLTSEKGEEVFRALEMPDKPTTLWMPGEDVVTFFSGELPKGLKPGVYSVRVALVDRVDESRHILLPLKNRDEQGRYTVCMIPGERRTTPLSQPQIPGADFETDEAIKNWWFAQGLKASLVKEDAPQGRQCLRLEGKTGEGWNYAGTPNIPLLPAAEYRLRGRMKVMEIDGVRESVVAGREGGSIWSKAPYFKIGLVDADGKWFANVNTARYDLAKMGMWQELECTFVTDPRTGSGHFAVEKGDTQPREVVLLVDDIRLELISAP